MFSSDPPFKEGHAACSIQNGTLGMPHALFITVPSACRMLYLLRHPRHAACSIDNGTLSMLHALFITVPSACRMLYSKRYPWHAACSIHNSTLGMPHALFITVPFGTFICLIIRKISSFFRSERVYFDNF